MEITEYTPLQVRHLRGRGISATARAAGRNPGGFHEHPGGLPGVIGEVNANLPPDTPNRGWWIRLLSAICWEESHGDSHAVSKTGALGPFQLTKFIYGEDAGKGYSAINPFQWSAAQQRARAEMNSLLRRASAETSTNEAALHRALRGWKEGWVGSQKADRKQRGINYADRIIATMNTL